MKNFARATLERFNYFCGREKAQKTQEKIFILSLLCIFVAMILVDLL